MIDKSEVNLEEHVETTQRDYHVGKIRRESYARFLRTKRADIPEPTMNFFDWYSKLPPVRLRIPDVIIQGGQYIERMRLSFALFSVLEREVDFRSIRVKSARDILQMYRLDRSDMVLGNVKYLFIHDVETFKIDTSILDEIVLERFRKGNATIFVGKNVGVSEAAVEVVRTFVTRIDLEKRSMEHEHAELGTEGYKDAKESQGDSNNGRADFHVSGTESPQ